MINNVQKTALFIALSTLLAACGGGGGGGSSTTPSPVDPQPPVVDPQPPVVEPEPEKPVEPTKPFTPPVGLNGFSPTEASIADIHNAIQNKGTSCTAIVQSYLDRISAYDKAGPALHSVITVNPSALQEARALDTYYQQTGQLKGDLHCATVLVKDNIDVAGIATTGGSNALQDNVARDDAYAIKNVKNKGGIILAKANLDEFAFTFNGVSSHKNGGTTKNAYDLTKTSGGSSSGTATAVSASLATVGIGTDAGGSIRIPAATQGLVGLRPTQRLISQDGMIPLTPTQDTLGPLCRTTTDCAVLMNSLVGYDNSSSSNQRKEYALNSGLIGSESEYKRLFSIPTSYVAQNATLTGMRIGIVRELYAPTGGADSQLINNALNQAINELRAAGATVEDVRIDDLATIFSTRYASLARYEFKNALTRYLQTTNSKFKSYEALVASGQMINMFTIYNIDVATANPSIKEFYTINTTQRAPHVAGNLSKALDASSASTSYDALAYPSMAVLASTIGTGPAAGNNNRLSVYSGYPALSMPVAFVNSPRSAYPMSVNIEFLAREFDEPTLFKLATAYEKVRAARLVPRHTPSLY